MSEDLNTSESSIVYTDDDFVKGSNNTVLKNWGQRKLIAGWSALPMLLLFSVLFVVPLMIFAPNALTNLGIMLPLTVLTEVAVIYWVLNYAWKLDEWKQMLSLRKPNKWFHLLIGLTLGIIAFILLQGVAFGLTKLGLTLNDSDTSSSILALNGINRVIGLYLFTPFIVPLVEELLFRGAIMNSFLNSSIKASRRVPLAIVFSSVLFAFSHFQGLSSVTDVFLLFWTFLIAVMNALLVIRFKSIWPAVAAHVGYNGATVLVSVIAATMTV